MKFFTLMLLAATLSGVAHATTYQCQTRSGQILTYGYGGCPTGTIVVGRSSPTGHPDALLDGSSRSPLKFSDSLLDGLRTFGQPPQSNYQVQPKIIMPTRHVHSWSFRDRDDSNGVCNFLCTSGAEMISAPINPNGFCSFPSS